MSVVKARDVRVAPPLQDALESNELPAEMAGSLKEGDIWVIRQAVSAELLRRLRSYLVNIAQGSLPNYHPIVDQAPNFHRVYGDPRSYVEGRFHQWSFFPWNQDVFNLFSQLRDVYVLNNRINGWPDGKFLGLTPEEGCTARLTVQAYPRGVGYLKRHTDAVGPHKFTTVSCCMSEKRRDFHSGGLVLQTSDDRPDLDMDAQLQLGDLVWIHSHVAHEVASIDPDEVPNWLAFEGKWTLICAVNKLEETNTIENSAVVE